MSINEKISPKNKSTKVDKRTNKDEKIAVYIKIKDELKFDRDGMSKERKKSILKSDMQMTGFSPVSSKRGVN